MALKAPIKLSNCCSSTAVVAARGKLTQYQTNASVFRKPLRAPPGLGTAISLLEPLRLQLWDKVDVHVFRDEHKRPASVCRPLWVHLAGARVNEWHLSFSRDRLILVPYYFSWSHFLPYWFLFGLLFFLLSQARPSTPSSPATRWNGQDCFHWFTWWHPGTACWCLLPRAQWVKVSGSNPAPS